MLVPQPQALPDFLRSDSMLTDFDFAVRAGWTPPVPEAGLPGGPPAMERAFAANIEIAAREGRPPRPAAIEAGKKRLMDPTGNWSASMLRDLEGGGSVEADHIVGWMLERARKHGVDDTLQALKDAYKLEANPAAIALFAVIMHLSVMNGAPAPDWYRLPGAQRPYRREASSRARYRARYSSFPIRHSPLPIPHSPYLIKPALFRTNSSGVL